MKTQIFSVLFLMGTLSIYAQQNNYYMALCKTLPSYSECNTSDDYQRLGDQFSNIASSDTTEWLADYYYVHSYIVSSLLETNDLKQKDALLDKVSGTMKRLKNIAPEESEVWTLLGMYYTAKLLVDPETRGYQYLGLSNLALEKALELDADNPRAKLMVIRNDMGASKYFGGAVKEYCEKAKELYNNWENYKTPSPLYPSWGKKQLSSIMAECNL